MDHGVKTISRFYINNFDDGFKQEIIDILVNKKNSTLRHDKAILNQFPEFTLNCLTLMEYKKMEFFPLSREWLEDIVDKA